VAQAFPFRRWLYLPIEVKVRELAAKTLTGALAAARGYGAVLGGTLALRPAMRVLPPGIFIEKGAGSAYRDDIKGFLDAGHRGTAWEEEGLRHRFSGAIDLLDRYFAWGDAQARDLSELSPEAAQRVIITGNPRFDLLRPEFRGIFTDSAAALKKSYGPFILVNTNFSTNTFPGIPTARERALRDPHMTDEFRARRLAYLEADQRVCAAFARAMPALSASWPDHRIVIRPHPAENHGYWREVAASLPNVVVEHRDSVIPWLLACDVLLHSNCTTALEAHLLGVPVIAYSPDSPSVRDWDLTNAVSTAVADEGELHAALSVALEAPGAGTRRPLARADESLLQDQVAAIDGPFAVDRILDALDGIESEHTPLHWGLSQRGNLALHRARRKSRRLVRTLVKGPSGNEAYVQQKFPGLDLREVEAVLEQLARVAPELGSVRASSMGRDMVMLQRQP
jgi:surface carbohydrate biosynthesis protein